MNDEIYDEIYTTSDWMKALASAINNRDTEGIEKLQNLANSWIQLREDSTAYYILTESALEIVYEVKENGY
jgi:Asp-tRNA(Asn)/Glu-tRNA(Gln) amidotransferase C subunit